MKKETAYFLPYQLRWLNDSSPVKIWEKSRRIGATYVQSYEDVRDVLKTSIPAVWFSSADESAAKEYIIYCTQWAKLFNAAAKDLGEVLLDEKRGIKAFQVQFQNGKRINALSSNPKAFRSKGGKVVLDEFAHHDNAPELWKAAKPAITWGFPLRILSTHNGKNSLFYKMVQQSVRLSHQSQMSHSSLFSLHSTDIFTAAQEGLVSKILGRSASKEDVTSWLTEQERDAFDKNTWLEEYCCIPVDAQSAFLTYDEIASVQSDFIPQEDGPEFIGVDIGRKKDLTVIWLLRKLGRVLYTIEVKILENTKFSIQKDILFSYLKRKNLVRCCIDATGIGAQLAEEAIDHFGKYKVEAITFTGRSKEEMAYTLRRNIEDKTIVIPDDHDIREDLHSIRKVTTAANNIRFDVAQSEVSGHADRFWALALASHADNTNTGPIIIKSTRRRSSLELVKNF